MTIYDLKPAFQRLLKPLMDRMHRAGITPNQVTLAALAMSIATGAAMAYWVDDPRALLLLPPVLFARMALNAIDGMLARGFGMMSPLGAMLNELGDVVSDAALYLPLALGWGFLPAPIVVAVLLAALSEMAGVVAKVIGASRRYDGPMGKSDRAFAFGAMALLLGCGVPPGLWQNAVVCAVGLLLCVTIFNRARRALAEVNA